MDYDILKPNRELLNPRFEGYKLGSLEHQLQTLTLASSVCYIPLKDDQYNYAHLKPHSGLNLMTLDSWNEKTILLYYVDNEFQVMALTYENNNNKLGSPVCVFKIPPRNETVKDPVSASVIFPSKEFVLVNDGAGRLYLVRTGERLDTTAQDWSDYKLLNLCDINDSFYFVYATNDANRGIIHSILMTVEDAAHLSGQAIVTLHWLQIKEQCQISQISADNLVGLIKRFRGTSVPVYCSLSPDFSELVVAGEGRFHLLRDNCNGIPEDAATNGESNDSDEAESYTWSQTTEFLTVSFSLPESTEKEDIICNLKQCTMNAELKDGTKLLFGNLEKDIDPEASKWIIEKNRLEVILFKKTTGEFWDTVVLGNKRGKHVIEGEEKERIKEITERLDQYTSENPFPSSSSEKPSTYNIQQLEECDVSSDEDAKLVCINKESGNISLETSITGHQWLFNISIEPNEPLYFCVRHDVDGILYKPVIPIILDNTHHKVSWKHVATFNAFGYITASKQDMKYTVCGKDFDFIAIVDCKRNIYAYLHDDTKQNLSKQYVLKLDHSEDILGVQTSKDTLFILSSSHLHAMKMF